VTSPPSCAAERLVASIVALGGAMSALLAKSGHTTEGAAEPSFARV
jgi:hypothetical protein